MREGHDLIPLAPSGEIDMSAAWRLSRILGELSPDVIHAHDPHAVAMAAVALSMAMPEPRPRFVISRRSDFPTGPNSFSRWKYGLVDLAIASSAAVRDRLIRDGIPAGKIVIVHEGVDVERIVKLPAGNVHAAFYLPTGAPVVGTVSALVPHKGHQYLIDAAALVVRDVPDVRFVILGDGERREALERQIHDKHLERHVFLGGYREDAVELTKGFDVFAMSSLSEGLCITLIDAMATARPAVATRAGGIPEVLIDGETGYLVEPRDNEALATRLIELLADKTLQARMGAAALARARECFTVARMVDGTVNAYASAAD